MPSVPFPCSCSFRKKLTTKQSWNNRAGIELKTSSPANHSAIPISLHKSHLRKVPAARDMNWGPGSWRPNKSRSYLPSERCRRQLGHRVSKKTRLNWDTGATFDSFPSFRKQMRVTPHPDPEVSSVTTTTPTTTLNEINRRTGTDVGGDKNDNFFLRPRLDPIKT